MLQNSYFYHSTRRNVSPLPNRKYFALESDNVSAVYGNAAQIATYNGISKGIGRIQSDFGTEFLIFENGAGAIQSIHGTSFVERNVTSLGSIVSLIIFNRSFCAITFDTVTSVVTATFYKISGSDLNPVAVIISQKELEVPWNSSNPTYGGSVKLSDTLGCGMQLYTTDTGLNLIKIEKPDTFDDDAVLSRIVGQFGAPAALGFRGTFSYSGGYYYFNNTLPYHALIRTITNSGGTYWDRITVQILNKEETEILSTGTISLTAEMVLNNANKTEPECMVFIDDSGNATILAQWNSNASTFTQKIACYSLPAGGTLTHLGTTTQTGGFYGSNTKQNVPLLFDKYPNFRYYAPNGSVNRKAAFNWGSNNFTLSNSARTTNESFGRSVKWA